MTWNNLLSGALGALFIFVIQIIYEKYNKWKTNKEIKKALLSYLKKAIVTNLKRIIPEYDKTSKTIMKYKNESIGGEIYTLNFNELSSNYLRSKKFINYIEGTGNQELHVLYLNLITLLNDFEGQFPIDFILRTGQLNANNLDPKQKKFQLENCLYQIKVMINNAKLSLERVMLLVSKLEH